MNKKRLFVGFLFCVLVFGNLIGCSRVKKGTDGTDGGKQLVFGSVGEFFHDSWDGAVGWNGWAIGSIGVGETLFRLDDALSANPWLAKNLEKIDDTTWRLTLRDDVFFHNGKRMTADSVKKCFERAIKVNDRTLESIPNLTMSAEGQILTITSSEKIASIRNVLTDPIWIVYDAESGGDFGEMSYYTGPFKPVSFLPFNKTVVEKFDAYWGIEPSLDGAELLNLNDFDALTMALQNGEVDVGVVVDSAAMPVFHNDPKLTIESKTSTRGYFFTFNMDSPVVQDLAVRTAISMCIDREGYCRTITNDTKTPSYGIYPSILSYGGTEGLNQPVTKYDPEGAKKVLSDAGYADSNGNGILDKNGTELSVRLIVLASRIEDVRLADVMIQVLADVGIRLNVEAMESWFDTAKAGDFDILSASYGMAPTGTPDYLSRIMFLTGGSNNYGRYSNPEVDALINEFSVISDISQRDKLVRAMQQKLLDDCAFIFYAFNRFTCVYNNTTVASFKSHPSELYILDSEVKAK